ncbi:DNA cross-link repair 1A protein [Triplophysa rosa]|uniref:DNA cross-link repair 1A protein n=1 Tax=Triplophysa rosa TaxID=992332 RepID=A0A9W7WEZ0_TRIRA|nr:DNA cross-link repair 1A protein [Triplophysa rosa]KAI7796624.1 DNA cross-link repair 1A protein [Triplophysa rosa]
MSQSGSESDIWDYKPLKKTKRKSNISGEHGAKMGKRRKSSARKTNAEDNGAEARADLDQNNDSCLTTERSHQQTPSDQGQASNSLDVQHGRSRDAQDKEAESGGFCPVCQMPFSVLVVQSQQWHVAECLDTQGEDSRECPDGLRCTSSIPSHYKRYSHSLLAHSRARNDSVSTVPTQTCTIKATSDFKSVGNVAPVSSTESSVDSAVNVSTFSSQSSSVGEGLTQTPTKTNALLLLRSPNTEDIKKKKGWSSSTKRSQSQSSSQEARSSTPVKPETEVKEEFSAFNDDDYISYSPLSELPGVDEEHTTQKTNKELLFHDDTVHGDESEVDEEEGDEDSLKLFSDDDDELFINMLDHYETNSQELGPHDSLNTCVKSQSSLTPDDLIASSFTGVSDGKSQHGPLSQSVEKQSTANSKLTDTQLQSPQSLVLERLRERISSPAHINNLGSEATSANISQDLFSSQTPLSTTQKTLSMAPRRTQTKGGPSGLKQTDIGVFFGLKPLTQSKAEEELDGMEAEQQGSRKARIVKANDRDAKRAGKRRRKNEVSNVSPAAEDGTAQPTQTEGGRGGRAAGWKRWNRERATDGDPEVHKRCPFYKKIPGTGFAVDAFQYGLVEGVTAYFLTHFHSDHYNGLKKDSVFPIYCNKITGNLVKSKLKVDEQYVHVLPVNTQCTVQGVKVTLLDANHCPGAAILLFVLPDGQTVLHTGDFRADPSMERYPELQGLRIQSLYLDTTYCSPEYTFPTQQEVITFAVNTAFEWVTLNPRTLIVCGTYAVGKEKVFLAVSEVLGSKVCLSRDKYNTMCCLESEQIGRRITTDWQTAQVHVLPMMQLNFKNLRTHLKKFSRKYDQLVAFKPTGWTFNQTVRVEDIQPQTQGNISIYGIPYSEHSSYLELKRFVQWLRPKKIIPTVNVGSWKSRKAMESYFHEWQTEPRIL